MNEHPEKDLEASWVANALAWTHAVRAGCIESRQLGTDVAILEAIATVEAQHVLDVGCGEGWLVRALTARGYEAMGVDGSRPLVEEAQRLGGTFRTLSYDEMVADPARLGGLYDTIVCNFSLLGASLSPLLTALRSVLQPSSHLIIQTVHPFTACGDAAYADGWRTETFDHFGEAFKAPMPWYFRTMGSWLHLLQESGFQITDCAEPLHPETSRPLSLLITGRSQAD